MSESENQKGGCSPVLIGFVIFLAILVIGNLIFSGPNPDYAQSKYSESENLVEKKYTLRLTHSLGKDLKVKARLNFGASDSWVLKFDSGETITYRLITVNSEDVLCGIKAIDSNGDACEICMSKEGETSKVRFRYDNDVTIVYSGYLE